MNPITVNIPPITFDMAYDLTLRNYAKKSNLKTKRLKNCAPMCYLRAAESFCGVFHPIFCINWHIFKFSN